MGLMSLSVSQRHESTKTPASLGGTVRWMAPELFSVNTTEGEQSIEADDGDKRNYASDVYAYGITIYEVSHHNKDLHCLVT